jgi:hypothetical protein
MESYGEVEHAIRDIIYEALDELAGDGVTSSLKIKP